MKLKCFCKHRTLSVHKWEVRKTEKGTKINAVFKCQDCGKKIPTLIERNVKWELAHDNEYLYTYILGVDATKSDSDRIAYYVEKANGSLANVDYKPNTGALVKNDVAKTAVAGILDGNYVMKSKIALADLKIADDAINFAVRFINKGSVDAKYTYYTTKGATSKSDGSAKIESTSGLVAFDLADYEPAPAPAFDASTLALDEVFDGVEAISEFNCTNKGTVESSRYTLRLANDEDYLYIYMITYFYIFDKNLPLFFLIFF